jgi:hypothetical protein
MWVEQNMPRLGYSLIVASLSAPGSHTVRARRGLRYRRSSEPTCSRTLALSLVRVEDVLGDVKLIEIDFGE